MLYLVMQLGLAPADAVVYQSMLGSTVQVVKTAVTHNLLVHSESEDQRLRRNIRQLSSVANLH